jgi:hypothetical protein
MDKSKSIEMPPEEEARMAISITDSDDEVATLAYQLWMERGCPIGSPEVDWFQAEEQLKNRGPVLLAASAS